MVPLVLALILPWILLLFGCWLGYQLVRQNGRVLLHLERIEERLGAVRAMPAPAARLAPAESEGLAVGNLAPDFQVPNLEGEPRSLADFRGKKALLIFFNPGCGYCSRKIGRAHV